jgi:hypothetical protein
MESPPDRERSKPGWMKTLRWETSAPFKVRWLVAGEVKTTAIKWIKNEYYDYEAVTKGFDCQEIGPVAGKQLIDHLALHMKSLK